MQTNARGTQYRTAALAQVQHYCSQLESMLAQAASLQAEAELLLPLQPPGESDDSQYPSDSIESEEQEDARDTQQQDEGGFDTVVGLGTGLVSHGFRSSPSWSVEGESLSLASVTEGTGENGSFYHVGSSVSSPMGGFGGSMCSPRVGGLGLDGMGVQGLGMDGIGAASMEFGIPASSVDSVDGKQESTVLGATVAESAVETARDADSVPLPPSILGVAGWDDDEDADDESSTLLVEEAQRMSDVQNLSATAVIAAPEATSQERLAEASAAVTNACMLQESLSLQQVSSAEVDADLVHVRSVQPSTVAGHRVGSSGSDSGDESEGEAEGSAVPLIVPFSQLYSPLPVASFSESSSGSIGSTSSLFPNITPAAAGAAVTTGVLPSSSTASASAPIMVASVSGDIHTLLLTDAGNESSKPATTVPASSSASAAAAVDPFSTAVPAVFAADVEPTVDTNTGACTEKSSTAGAVAKKATPAAAASFDHLPFDYSSGFLRAMSQADPTESLLDESFMSSAGDSQPSSVFTPDRSVAAQRRGDEVPSSDGGGGEVFSDALEAGKSLGEDEWDIVEKEDGGEGEEKGGVQEVAVCDVM